MSRPAGTPTVSLTNISPRPSVSNLSGSDLRLYFGHCGGLENGFKPFPVSKVISATELETMNQLPISHYARKVFVGFLLQYIYKC